MGSHSDRSIKRFFSPVEAARMLLARRASMLWLQQSSSIVEMCRRGQSWGLNKIQFNGVGRWHIYIGFMRTGDQPSR
jgi:hypothetical protein